MLYSFCQNSMYFQLICYKYVDIVYISVGLMFAILVKEATYLNSERRLAADAVV